MNLVRGIERPTHARAVADAPVEELLARGDELARRWAVALILERPLAELGEIPLDELARVAPALCGELARALASDEQLERLARGEAIPATLLFERGPGAVVADFEALRAILWEATLAELRDPAPRLVADLADRLAQVCATALAATLDARSDGASPPRAARPPAQAPDRGRVLYGTQRREAGHSGAVLVDEAEQEPRPLAFEDAEDAPDAGAPRVAAPDADGAPASSLASRATPRARPWDTPLSDEPALRVSRGGAARVDERR